MATTYRTEHVGSMVRPARLLDVLIPVFGMPKSP